jgi:hypothetical protein
MVMPIYGSGFKIKYSLIYTKRGPAPRIFKHIRAGPQNKNGI